MSPRKKSAAVVLLLSLALLPAAWGQEGHEGHHSATAAPAAPKAPERVDLDIPDVPVLDQEGASLHFYSDLVQGRVVAVNFLFTNCTTICPPLGVTFAKLRKLLGERAGRDVHLISVSVDPVNDTPARLKAWASKFGFGPGWSLVTGKPDDITRLLKALGAYTADPNDHPPLVLIGSDAKQYWTRAYGLAPPPKLAALIDEVAKAAEAEEQARSYFGDTVLIDQDGHEQRLFSDLMAGKVVVIHAMFTVCETDCPLTATTLKRLQEHLGSRLGPEARILSITLDPGSDTPARLQEHARKLEARPGWMFLTGKSADVETVLGKLGLTAPDFKKHKPLLLVGNVPTGLWKKVFPLASTEEVLAVVDSVLDDPGEGGPS